MSIPKFYSAINYDFQPISYWSPEANPLEVALRNVKGRNRREMIRDYYSRGLLPTLSENLLRDTLDEETRRSIGQIHPSFMGGEYLPDWGRHEVEIGRIELESTTNDVISVRARSRGGRIEYSIRDEYGSEFTIPQRTSIRPFSLRELIRFLDRVEQIGATDQCKFGFILSFNQCNLECGTELSTLEDFTRVESGFYPELGLHYARVINEWYESRLTEFEAQERKDSLAGEKRRVC